MNTKKNRIKIGTRGSKLSRVQTDRFIADFVRKFSDTEYEVIPITVIGERDYARPIAELGTEGVFIKELEEALLNNEVDLVVHSLKDLPTTLPSNLSLACVCNREDPRDVIVSRDNIKLVDLPKNSRIATSSRRRMAQLRTLRNDLIFMDIRGNVPTRIAKLDDGYCDAIVLAAAGLHRLGLDDRIAEYLDLDIFLPVPGQGALGIECRANDPELITKLKAMDDPRTRFEVTAERAFLAEIGGGCTMPIGALGRLVEKPGTVDIEKSELLLMGCVTSLDGKRVIKSELSAPAAEADMLGKRLAIELLKKGAQIIVEELRHIAPAVVSPP